MPRIAERLKSADRLLIGAGAGLSASGGMSYQDPQVWARLFPELQNRGFKTVWDAVSHYWTVNDRNRLSYWAYWALHIQRIRYEAPAAQVYVDLLSLVKERPYFIFTTNVDGQFAKAGFDPRRMFSPQGDYALFQCRRPCSDDLYDNREMVGRMLANLDFTDFRIRPEDIPRCPRCGDYLERNLRIDDTFVEAPHMQAQPAYAGFVNSSLQGSLLILELGVGFNTPGVIRWPFEEITARHPGAFLVRVNRDEPEVPPELGERAVGLSLDIAAMLRRLASA